MRSTGSGRESGSPATAAGRAYAPYSGYAVGAAAIGFGVGLGFDDVPADLVEAADQVGLPLLEVPLPVPFSAIARTVLDHIAAERFDQFVRASHTQPRITRAIIAGGMPVLRNRNGG